MNSEIDQIAESLKAYYLTNQLAYYEKLQITQPSEINEQAIKKMSGILGELNESIKEKHLKATAGKIDKIENTFKNIDRYAYMKEWRKLTEFHKNVKLTEYFDTTYRIKPEFAGYAERFKELATLISANKDYSNDKCIDYDSSACIIKNIHVLRYNEETKEFILDPVKKPKVRKIKT